MLTVRNATRIAVPLMILPFLYMTSFAFILGCFPLWIANGAGAEGRRILGSVVISGMLAATAIAIFIIPVLFVVIERLASRKTLAEVIDEIPECSEGAA